LPPCTRNFAGKDSRKPGGTALGREKVLKAVTTSGDRREPGHEAKTAFPLNPPWEPFGARSRMFIGLGATMAGWLRYSSGR